MKRRVIDGLLICFLCLLALAEILVSAAGGEKVGVGLVAIFLSANVAVVGLLLMTYQRHTNRRTLSGCVLSLVTFAVIVSVAVTQWPLRVTYALSKSSFDALARRVQSGEQIKTPVNAGFFIVQRAELSRERIVCLWTEPNPGGNTGFVQCRPDYVPFNLWSMVRLDNYWQFIAED
jgi:hypothetical protein